MIIEISVALIALAFVVLVIYLVVMIQSLRVTLGEVNLITADLKRKMETLDPLFYSVENIGDVLECESAAYKEKKCLSLQEGGSDDLNVGDVVALAAVGIRLWNKFNKRSQS